MATITYPTQTIVEKCLQSIFPGLNHGCLNQSISILGNVSEYHYLLCKYGCLPVNVNNVTGVDIPILVTDNNEPPHKGTVVLLAQDPLRNVKKDDMLKSCTLSNGCLIGQNPIVGTPFAFHYQPQFYSQTEAYRVVIRGNNTIMGLLSKGYQVYVTDVWKTWDQNKLYRRGRWGINNPHTICLIEELNVIKPNYIILMGKQAQNKYRSIANNLNFSPTLVIGPHLSNAANGAWNKLIGSTALHDKVNYYLNQIP